MPPVLPDGREVDPDYVYVVWRTPAQPLIRPAGYGFDVAWADSRWDALGFLTPANAVRWLKANAGSITGRIELR